MKRCIVNVATGPLYVRGQQRLWNSICTLPVEPVDVSGMRCWRDQLPPHCPPYSEIPYAFKAFALKQAADEGADVLLWCDASIVPIRSLEPLWERIERDGYWFSKNGFSNYEWTADSAYPDLFNWPVGGEPEPSLDDMRAINRKIPHVVATAFGLNVKHEKGAAFLAEYFRLASETKAFCGPWQNLNHADAPGSVGYSNRCGWCGPPDVRGHRHDQTAASVIAWRLGMQLTDPPDVFVYSQDLEDAKKDERTILVAKGIE